MTSGQLDRHICRVLSFSGLGTKIRFRNENAMISMNRIQGFRCESNLWLQHIASGLLKCCQMCACVFLLLFLDVEWNRVHYYWGQYWSIVPSPDDDEWWWVWSTQWNAGQGKSKYSEKTCPSASLSATNTTWPDPGSNLGRRGGKPATNRLRYGTVLCSCYYRHCIYVSLNI
jgi:hypothetical protein